MIDAESLRLLRDLPDDIKARGWEFILQESGKSRTWANPDHKAVYVRPLDPGVDNERLLATVHRNGRSFVHVSTRSPSWKVAREDAIQRMREIDAQCSRRE